LSTEYVIESDRILLVAEKYQSLGLKQHDALHVSCAFSVSVGFFITTDKGILKKKDKFKNVQILDPIGFIRLYKEIYND
jgi:predicted nucleic acid-binding protein